MEVSYTEKLWRKIQRYSVISFDIFDTLIKRNVCIPEDVFDIVQEQFEIKNEKKLDISFKEERKKAGLTQEEFAMRSGLGLRFVRELEQGKETVRMDKVNQALAMFGKEAVPGEKEE